MSSNNTFLGQLRHVRSVFANMDRAEFVEILCDYYNNDYIISKFPEFQRDPFAFCMTRNPPGPGYRLINYALEKEMD